MSEKVIDPEGFFPIIVTCKEDMRDLFKHNKKVLKYIKDLSSSDMERIASKFFDDYCAHDYCVQLYWECLKNILIDYITYVIIPRKELKEK